MFSFMIYSVFGWGIDSLVRTLSYGTWTTGNALGIPFSPMYGIAAVGVLWIAPHIKRWQPLSKYIFFSVIAAVYEYSGGVISEKFLGRRLWDYSEFPFHAHAYTDPTHALAWGGLIMAVVYWIHPRLRKSLRIAASTSRRNRKGR